MKSPESYERYKERMWQMLPVSYTETTVWQIEVVKHLMLLNAVGLAGATTLFASSAVAEGFRTSNSAASAFAGGLTFAFALMLYRWICIEAKHRNLVRSLNELDRDSLSVEDVNERETKCVTHAMAFFMALGSFILFVRGMYLLGPVTRSLLH
jgi:hypothetical protein